MNAETDPKSESESADSSGCPARILIVDDEESIRHFCSDILERHGYETAAAETGAAGLEAIEAFHPDLLLLDLEMPDMHGFDILEEVRSRDPYLITVVITGFATVQSAVKAMRRGAYDYLPKPFTAESLLKTIRLGLEKRRYRMELARFQQEKEAMRKRFMSMVSHELRSPLAAVEQNLMVISGGMVGEIPEKAQKMLERSGIRIKRLIKLIGDWLDLSRIEGGMAGAEKRPVDLCPLIREVMDIYGPLARRKRVRLRALAARKPYRILGNEELLHMLFSNLIHNAIKYNRKEGHVRVSVGKRGKEIVIRVKDNGLGIPAEHVDRVFNEFYRVKNRKDQRGSGLGLSIARRIAEVHDGCIHVESEPDQGSCFEIRFPEFDGAEPDPSAPPS